ncbi:putative carboxypeptidase [Podospora australis]|uniref:Carboxypeptidase n=1 Tax=Podospora australis TaxID=1536484 RepID=A0AAN6WMM3_9PEZI|nr:putative carboxypeptidase [Podospora australis]
MRFLLLIQAALAVTAQNFVPLPEGTTTFLSKKYPGASISYKQTSICETTPGVKAYSGYVHLPSTLLADVPAAYNVSLFFWYFQARNNPDKAPVSIYVGGGPGSSAFDDTNGFPCTINSDGNSTTLNKWSWNNNVNMLYIDQPVMAGFSYSTIANGVVELLSPTRDFTPVEKLSDFSQTNSTTLPATISAPDPSQGVNTTAQAARTMWHFAQVWFQEFPEYKTSNNEISIWTVSYGGFFAPAIFAHFQRQNERLKDGSLNDPSAKILNLATIGLQNACIDVDIMAASYPDFAYKNTYGIEAYPKEIYDEVHHNITKPGGGCRDLLKNCREAGELGDPLHVGNNETVNQLCAVATEYCFGVVQGAYTVLSNRTAFNIAHFIPSTFPPVNSPTFFNRPWVQSHLGVPVNFTLAPPLVQNVFFGLTGDPLRRDISDLNYLLSSSSNISLAFVYGDLDYRCSWLGGEAVSLAAEYSDSQKFRDAGYADLVTSDTYKGGVVRQFDRMSFSRVFLAGHSVYAYQPETVYKIFDRVMGGKDVATGEEEQKGYASKGPKSSMEIRQQAPGSPESICYIDQVGTTCTENQIEALMAGTAVIENGVVVEPKPLVAGFRSAQTGGGIHFLTPRWGVLSNTNVYLLNFAQHNTDIIQCASLCRTQASNMQLTTPSQPNACDAMNKHCQAMQQSSRRGCITCRIRRVKCDETKPSCTRCTSSGRTCDGYVAETTSLSGRALATAVKKLHVVGPASRVLGEAVPSHDASCFDFFRVCTAAMTGSVFLAPFWSKEVLQVAHAEPAVWKAAVAIGALHRRWEYHNKTRRHLANASEDGSQGLHDIVESKIDRFTQQAMEQYWGAISLARSISDPQVLVVVSVILAAAANMAGQWTDSQVHTRAGLRMLDQVQSTKAGEEGKLSAEMESVALTLSRLDLMAMSFEDSRAQYVYLDANGKITDSLIKVPSITSLESLTSASITLFGMIRYYYISMVVGGARVITPEEFNASAQRVMEAKERWESEFERLVAEVEAKPSVSEATGQMILSLRLYHANLELLMNAGIEGLETRWDPQLPIYERIIDLAETLERNTQSPLPFFMSLELGLVMPAFLVGVRCRHPIVRRKALRLLKRLNRQEGMWNSVGVTLVLEQIILTEEEDLPFRLPLYVENLDSLPPDGLRGEGWPMPTEEMRQVRNEIIVDVERNRVELTIYRGDNQSLIYEEGVGAGQCVASVGPRIGEKAAKKIVLTF